MYTRGKRFILLVVASTAVTCSASFALRRFWRTFSETYSHLSMSVRNRLPNRERNARPTSSGAKWAGGGDAWVLLTLARI